MFSFLFSDIDGDENDEKNITDFTEDETMVELLTTLFALVIAIANVVL